MRRFLPLSVILLAAAGPSAHAATASTTASTVSCVRACPQADLVTHIVVRDLGGNPIVGSQVWLDFSRCPGFVHCPLNGSENHVWDEALRVARSFTWTGGVVDFYLRGGGVCGPGTVSVYADGVRIAERNLASPDQDGSLLVDGADALHVNSLLGSADPTADLDCDGTVTNTDLSILTNQHGGHSCTNVVPARPRSWGSIKQIYR